MDAKQLGNMPLNGSLGNYGITLRQHYAGLAMQGAIKGATWADMRDGADDLAECAVICADALLAELAKDTP